MACVYDAISPNPPSNRSSGVNASANQSSQSHPLESTQMEIQTEQVPASDTVMTVPSGPSPSMSVPSEKAFLTPSSQPQAEELQILRFRVKQLEEQLTKTVRASTGPATPSPNYNISTTRSHFAGTFHVTSESATAGQPPTISRSIMHKTRVFGQSHWMNGVAQVSHYSASCKTKNRY